MTTSQPALEFSSFAEVYERLLVGPLFRPWAEVLLSRADVKPGDRLLDVACGTGIVARLARPGVGDEGRVVAVDLNPQMLAVGRPLDPGIDWREGNAMALPIEEGEEFDVCTCHQGIQFVPDKPLAIREMRRVLAPTGRLAIAAWRPQTEVPLLMALQDVAERHVGPVVDQRHSYGDEQALANLLDDAGFGDVRVDAVSLTIRFADPSVFVRLNAMALVGMSAMAKQIGNEERATIVAAIMAESADAVAPHLDGQELAFDLLSNVATARR